MVSHRHGNVYPMNYYKVVSLDVDNRMYSMSRLDLPKAAVAEYILHHKTVPPVPDSKLFCYQAQTRALRSKLYDARRAVLLCDGPDTFDRVPSRKWITPPFQAYDGWINGELVSFRELGNPSIMVPSCEGIALVDWLVPRRIIQVSIGHDSMTWDQYVEEYSEE